MSFLIGFASIAFMITIHETGHFIGARIAHIDVEVFAIGWGKAIKKWYRGGVEYRINIFLLGGYCKLKGGDDLLKAVEDKSISFDKTEKGSLFTAHPFKRIITYLGGPLVNLLFAFILFIPFFMVDYYASSVEPKILLTTDYPEIYVDSINSAKDAGLISGDVIISIEGKDVTYFSEISELVNEHYKKKPLEMIVLRNSSKLVNVALTPTYDDLNDRYLVGVTSAVTPLVSETTPLSPEHIAGIGAGDTIVGVNGIPVSYTIDVVNELIKSPDFVELGLVSDLGVYREVSYYPEKDSNGNVKSNIVFHSDVTLFDGLSFFPAIISSVKETVHSIGETVRLFGQLVMGKFSFTDSLAGPVRISYIIGQVSSSGAHSFLQLLAMISISLGIANLLPIPGLDGGSIVLSMIELVRRKTFSPRLYIRFQSFGVVLLGMLMLFVLFTDARFLLS